MATSTDDLERNGKTGIGLVDIEKQRTVEFSSAAAATPKSLGAGVSLLGRSNVSLTNFADGASNRSLRYDIDNFVAGSDGMARRHDI